MGWHSGYDYEMGTILNTPRAVEVVLTRGNPSLRVSCQLEFKGQEGSGMIGGRAAETRRGRKVVA